VSLSLRFTRRQKITLLTLTLLDLFLAFLNLTVPPLPRETEETSKVQETEQVAEPAVLGNVEEKPKDATKQVEPASETNSETSFEPEAESESESEAEAEAEADSEPVPGSDDSNSDHNPDPEPEINSPTEAEAPSTPPPPKDETPSATASAQLIAQTLETPAALPNLYDLLSREITTLFTEDDWQEAVSNSTEISSAQLLGEPKISGNWAEQEIVLTQPDGTSQKFLMVLVKEDGEWRLLGTIKI